MIANEVALRLGFFLSTFVIIGLWEYIAPRRSLLLKKTSRWIINFSLIVLSAIATRIFIPFTVASLALFAEHNQIGVFNNLSLPYVVAVALSLLLMDLLIYAQHVVFHHNKLFWRLHKVHHIDHEIDVTTALRFHPLEIVFSAFIKGAAVLLLGVPLLAVIAFEVLLNLTAMFNHGNIHLPSRLDKWLRMIIVTPDMHRVHHSTLGKETNCNFGFNLPWWDMLFKTYRDQPENGHLKMSIGLNEYRDPSTNGLLTLLTIPFKRNSIIRSDND
jgi:sterol desaturase/sphingolipid hydroxylase (fatty acid hydroxylase superfamily)|tara:strand:+ start:1810 stop:2625 length:816 start_codon:yes stop_codon:yes gene_type:complete